jgi:2,5-furandicarboxylate decarboxylase 1
LPRSGRPGSRDNDPAPRGAAELDNLDTIHDPRSGTVTTTDLDGSSAPTTTAKTLGSYLETIRGDPAELRTVSRPVNPMEFDVTAVLEHLDRRGEYPTVVFERPLDLHGEPSPFPIVSNLWATRERCAEAVGLSRSEAGRELGSRFAELVKHKREPVVVADDDAAVHANVLRGDDADMWRFPVVRHFEMDLGGAMTMALAMHPPGEDFYNITFVKSFPESPRRGGLTIHSAHLSRITKLWERRGERFPVVNILGHHPGFWLGTLNSTPWGGQRVRHGRGLPRRTGPACAFGHVGKGLPRPRRRRDHRRG